MTSTILWWERKIRLRPWFFFLTFGCISEMLVHWVASTLRPPLIRIHEIGARKLSSLHLCGWCSTVCLYLITSQHSLPKSHKYPLPFTLCWPENPPLPPIPHMRTRILGNFQFSEVIFNSKSLGFVVSETVQFLIRLFIFLFQFQVSMGRSIRLYLVIYTDHIKCAKNTN